MSSPASHSDVSVGRLGPEHRETWEKLWRAYMAFYERTLPEEMYDAAWTRFMDDQVLHARGAWLDGHLVGITHFLVHPNTSNRDVCYLQDLFTAPEARSRGVARALIASVVDFARARECSRVYWNTQATNATARLLYDKVGIHRGFIRYDIDV